MVATTIMAGGIAGAQTMGEYANTTAMSTANKPPAPPDPASNMAEHRTWETNPWGGSWSDRVGNGGDFTSRAGGKGDAGSDSRWPGSSIGNDKTAGDTKRFETTDRFASDDKRFTGDGGERFKNQDSNRFPADRFHDDMGLDQHYNQVNTQHYDSSMN
jgi:hypothetical protein